MKRNGLGPFPTAEPKASGRPCVAAPPAKRKCHPERSVSEAEGSHPGSQKRSIMQIIDQYIEALENRDYVELANLFTPDGYYIDYSVSNTPQNDYHLYGREAISMFFRNRFLFRRYAITDPVVMNSRQAEFIARIDDYNIMVIANIQQETADGHIRRLTVRRK